MGAAKLASDQVVHYPVIQLIVFSPSLYRHTLSVKLLFDNPYSLFSIHSVQTPFSCHLTYPSVFMGARIFRGQFFECTTMSYHSSRFYPFVQWSVSTLRHIQSDS